MDDPTTWYAVAALAITTGGAVLTAWLARGRDQAPIQMPAGQRDALAGADLTTIAGIASVVVEQSQRITGTEARVGALSRYVTTLKDTIRDLGGDPPDPDPADRPLIEQ
ncbi:hypothetical protein [Actinacidiphila sp. ITFR-21]|uniref:hypothetical protein n=1 Tax=Actinacidiphila sp. ITFR-21 TaxID=3075199 RepID=UPI002889A599|nr:hypothetical protein [Streptomyces sp. ITFR-21]WNI16603.1 hypothetical protein RLT57_14520 [Streptomyces sp. ITFR-21]